MKYKTMFSYLGCFDSYKTVLKHFSKFCQKKNITVISWNVHYLGYLHYFYPSDLLIYNHNVYTVYMIIPVHGKVFLGGVF